MLILGVFSLFVFMILFIIFTFLFCFLAAAKVDKGFMILFGILALLMLVASSFTTYAIYNSSVML